MSSLDIAPYPEGAPAFGRDRCRIRRRLRVSFRRAGSCTFWRLGFRQFSFHRIARVSRRAVPDTWTRPPVSCHALFPLTFRRQVRHQTQENPSNPSRLVLQPDFVTCGERALDAERPPLDDLGL